ncbi:hypothetical protein LCGC14_2838810, partial [marine sediment metagenome]
LDTLRDKFVGITILSEWLSAIMGKQNADATALSEIRASGAGSGTYDPNTDSQEALLDDLGSRLPAALASGLMKGDMLAISGDTGAADRLEALMDSVLIITVNDASATLTAFAADGFTEAVDDIFKGRLMTFLDGANQFEQTDITGYDAADGPQGAQEFTVTALTAAPAEDVNAIVH